MRKELYKHPEKGIIFIEERKKDIKYYCDLVEEAYYSFLQSEISGAQLTKTVKVIASYLDGRLFYGMDDYVDELMNIMNHIGDFPKIGHPIRNELQKKLIDRNLRSFKHKIADFKPRFSY